MKRQGSAVKRRRPFNPLYESDPIDLINRVNDQNETIRLLKEALEQADFDNCNLELKLARAKRKKPVIVRSEALDALKRIVNCPTGRNEPTCSTCMENANRIIAKAEGRR